MDGLRVYQAHELGKDGYPPEWHKTVKHAVREQAGYRCVRCGHPYTKGAGEWSQCDQECRHGGPAEVWAGGMLMAGPDVAAAELARQVRHGAGVYARWRILTVHHLDGDKANCRWWNLIAVCQRCHLRMQGRVVMARVWPWEHSAWFQPYVAGYYASVYLGETLTREQVMARLEELLALERVA